MDLVVPLSPSIEEQLLAFAAREGRAPADVALEALREKLSPLAPSESGISPAQLESVVASRLEMGYDADVRRLEDDIATAKRILAELGLRFLEAEVECEPDDPRDCWVALTAEASQCVASTLELQLEWHARLSAAVGVSHGHLRICIIRAQK